MLFSQITLINKREKKESISYFQAIREEKLQVQRLEDILKKLFDNVLKDVTSLYHARLRKQGSNQLFGPRYSNIHYAL